MSAQDLGALVLVLLAASLAAALWGWTKAGPRIWAPGTLVLLAGAGLVAAVPDDVAVTGNGPVTLLVVLAGLLAVAGGGPVTARVFALVDRSPRERVPDDRASCPDRHAGSVADAGEVLRGGAWIGALERAAIFASLAVGQPEGVAVVLALKGLGRYPELRNGENTGTAERFIIGTFTSVLWAAACAGIVRLLT